MPSTRIAQPIATARCDSMRRAANCATADAAKMEPATAPATAWLSMPMTPATNDGATAVNSPVTAKPANAAVAPVTKTCRTSAGIDSRWNPMRPVRSDVSGASSTAPTASTTNTMCTMNDSCNGCGAYWTRKPASTGPAPKPSMLASVAATAARSRSAGGAASTTAAVAVPVKTPAERPDSSRPIRSSGTLSAIRKITALASANRVPPSNTGRLPMASDQRPNTSSAASTPTAYVA